MDDGERGFPRLPYLQETIKEQHMHKNIITLIFFLTSSFHKSLLFESCCLVFFVHRSLYSYDCGEG